MEANHRLSEYERHLRSMIIYGNGQIVLQTKDALAERRIVEADGEVNLTPVEVQDKDRAEDGVGERGGEQEGNADGRKVQHGDDLFAGPQLDVVRAPHHAGGREPVKN